ncbi:MAG: hypothetical protein ABJB34_12755 [Acidobacteriota bacterium]
MATFAVPAKTENWFERLSHVTVAKSTRRDIERVFKNPRIEKTLGFEESKTVYYTSKLGRIEVSYSSGPCIGRYGYNLPLDTVLSISFSPAVPLNASKLKLNLKGYEREKEDDTANWIYTNASLGRMYALFRDRELAEVSVGMSKADESVFACEKVK